MLLKFLLLFSSSAIFADSALDSALKNLCEDKSYFRVCFNLDKNLCVEKVSALNKKCTKTLSLEFQTDVEIAYRVGTCVAEFLEKESGPKKDLPKCKEVQSWR